MGELDGHAAGELDGHAVGELDGHAAGELDGHAAGELDGHAAGELDGHAVGELDGHAVGELDGHAAGELDGHAAGELDGHAAGELDGHAAGELDGHAAGELDGHAAGELDGHAAGNSTATLRENSTARAFDRSNVKATPNSPVLRHSKEAKISGGQVLDMHSPQTAEEWCEFYGIEIRKGGGFRRDLKGQDVAILFKALYADFRSYHRFSYDPGTVPAAPDWDGGKRECGGGLHFSPHPVMAEEFQPDAERYVACPVLVSEIVIHPDGMYPQKCKAPRACAPCWEVDRNGERIE